MAEGGKGAGETWAPQAKLWRDSFSGGRAGGAKASEDKGVEQFDNPVHGEAAEDS